MAVPGRCPPVGEPDRVGHGRPTLTILGIADLVAKSSVEKAMAACEAFAVNECVAVARRDLGFDF
jgi:hypothetical protein